MYDLADVLQLDASSPGLAVGRQWPRPPAGGCPDLLVMMWMASELQGREVGQMALAAPGVVAAGRRRRRRRRLVHAGQKEWRPGQPIKSFWRFLVRQDARFATDISLDHLIAYYW